MNPGPLPPILQRRVEELVRRAGLEAEAAGRLRTDLVGHLRDGLDAGRAPEDLLSSLGDPGEVAPLLAQVPRPSTSRTASPPDPPGLGERLRTVAGDVRRGARSLVGAPGFSATAILVLSVGLAAATVAGTVANEILLRPLPVDDPSSLVDVWAEVPGGNSFTGFAWADVRDLQDRDLPGELVAFHGTRLALGEEGEGARPVVAQLVSARYFDLLGVRPTQGRVSFPAAPAFGAPPVAVVSHDLWQESLGGDAGIVGRVLLLEGRPVEVVAVAPEGFRGTFIGFPVELWLPLTSAGLFVPGFTPEDRSLKPFELMGRLQPGVDAAEMERVLDQATAEIEEAHPEANRGLRVGVAPTTGVDHSLRRAVTVFVAVLLVLAGMVLTVACLNVGSLLLVRMLGREREVAIRLALGAGRARLVGSLLTETLLLLVPATLLGILLADQGMTYLRRFVAGISGGLGFQLALDHRVLALTVAAAMGAALVAAAAPGLHLARRDPAGALRDRAGGGGGSGGRSLLVAAQVALSVVLVVGAGLFGRSVLRATAADPGFEADRVAFFSVPSAQRPAEETTEGGAGMGTAASSGGRLLDEVAALPGIQAVGWAEHLPLETARTPETIRMPGVDPPPGREEWTVDVRRIGGGYLEVLNIPLLAGRPFTPAEVRDGSGVAVVSRAFTDRWGEAASVGRTLEVGGRIVRVVGVAGDARFIVQDPSPDPLVYLPARHPAPQEADAVLLRANDPLGSARGVAGVVGRLLPNRSAPVLRTPRQVLRQALFPQRVALVLVGGMGLVALLLASLGLYGVVQLAVTRDRRQLGVRRALGGGPAALLGSVLRRGFVVAAVGTVVGLGLAALLSPGVAPLLVAVSPRDPLTFGVVAVAFLAVALLASVLPAARALAIDPAEVLRGD